MEENRRHGEGAGRAWRHGFRHGVPPRREQARALRTVPRRASADVNVTDIKQIDDSPWVPPDRPTEQAFLAELDGVVVTVRDTRGADTEAACGQLRAAMQQRRSLRADGTLSPPRRAAAP